MHIASSPDGRSLRSSLSAQMLLASGVLLVLVAGLFLGLVGALQDQRGSARLAEHSQRVLVAAGELERLLVDMQTSVRGFAITGQPRFLEPARRAQRVVPARSAELARLVSDNPAQERRATGIAAGIRRYETGWMEPQIARARRDLAAARAAVATGRGEDAIGALRERFARFVTAERRLGALRSRAAGDDATRSLWFGVAGLVGSALLILLFALYLIRGVVMPVRRVAGAAQRLAAGDMAARVPDQGAGETARLGRAFNAMAVSLQGAQADLIERNADLARALEDLSRQSARVDTFYRFAELLAGERDDLDRLTRRGLEAIVRHAGAGGGVLVIEELGLAVAAGDAPAPGAFRLDLPLDHLGRTPGRLELHRSGGSPFSDDEREAAAHLAGQIEVALTDAASFRSARRQAAITRAVLDAVPDVIMLVDDEGRMLFRNRPAGALLRQVSAGEEPVSVYALVDGFAEHTTDPRGFAAAVDALRRDPELASRDEFSLAQGGRAFQRYAAPVRDGDGEVIGRIFVIRDVTAEREAERMKDEFVALASHELRTPLTSIIGYLDVVLEGELGELGEEQEQFLRVAARNADRLLALVGDLIVMGQSDAGRLSIQLRPLDVGELARDRTAAAGPTAQTREVALAVDAGVPAPILGDASRLGQVVDNLVSNALKFTPAGGRVDVRVAVDGDQVVLEVADTGVGIPFAEQPRLFERFYRTPGAQARSVPGTGLGLSISKAIVEAHGGSIDVESGVGRGSVFRARLPRDVAAYGASHERSLTAKEA
ncbi:MAG: hypothetical protein QOD86_3141 [Miltoncostaeaceae bacterium]|jgi:signal transduction histidine kinase/CHASE3 domain sensor protein|nr:hypothetical protein [Miltoncostaeaceae bacterium]